MWTPDVGVAAWRDAITGSHQPKVRLTVTYDGQATCTTTGRPGEPEIIAADWAQTLTGGDRPQIASTLELTLADPTGTLWTALPGSPIGWWGHRIEVQAGLRVGLWEAWVPLGVLRIDAIEPVESVPWRLTRTGRWVRGPQTLRITATDLLSQISDERFEAPQAPLPGGTVRSEAVRICAGIVPLAPWSDATPVPPSTSYDETDRLAVLLGLCHSAGRVAAMTRLGLLDAPPATGRPGATWPIPLDALVEAHPKGSRDQVRNSWVVTSDVDQTPLRAQSVEQSGLLRWGGPFGRVPAFQHLPILTTESACLAASQTARASSMAARRTEIQVTCLPDATVDCLDTAQLAMPGRDDITGLVTAIRLPLTGGAMQATVSAPMEVLS